MKRVTQTAILARAISDCTRAIRDAEAKFAIFADSTDERTYTSAYDALMRPLLEERETMLALYEIETGAPYEIDPGD